MLYAVVAVVLIALIVKHFKEKEDPNKRPDWKLGVLTVLLALDIFFLVSSL